MTNLRLGSRTARRPSHPFSIQTGIHWSILLVCIPSTTLTYSSNPQGLADEKDWPSIEQQLLSARGLSLTPESVRSILGDTLPGNLSAESIPNLIQSLGSDDYAAREAAMQKILKLPVPPIDLLEQAKAGDDLEIRIRAKRLLQQLNETEPIEDTLTFACLLLIRTQPTMKMSEELLQLAPKWTHPTFRRAGWLAMERTVRAEEVPRLKKAFEEENEATRAMALVGLLALSENSDQRRAALEDVDFSRQPKLVQFVFLKHRLEQGELQHLPELVAICYAEDAALRALTIHALHRAFDLQQVSKEQLLAQIERHAQQPENGRRREDTNLNEFAAAAWEALLARIDGKAPPAPEDWADYLSSKLLHGKSEGQATAFATKIATSLLSVIPIEKRTANTINSVTSRHEASPWLYPTQGKNEAPRVLCENGSWYFPIHGTWRQRWGGGWNSLDENGRVIKTDSKGGPHIESEVDYFVVPWTEE